MQRTKVTKNTNTNNFVKILSCPRLSIHTPARYPRLANRQSQDLTVQNLTHAYDADSNISNGLKVRSLQPRGSMTTTVDCKRSDDAESLKFIKNTHTNHSRLTPFYIKTSLPPPIHSTINILFSLIEAFEY